MRCQISHIPPFDFGNDVMRIDQSSPQRGRSIGFCFVGPPPFGPGGFRLSVMYYSMEYGGGSEVDPKKTSVGSS